MVQKAQARAPALLRHIYKSGTTTVPVGLHACGHVVPSIDGQSPVLPPQGLDLWSSNQWGHTAWLPWWG